jgi:hypothetical protein
MKKHKVIVGTIKDILKQKPKVIQRSEVDSRPKNLEANLILFCGGKAYSHDSDASSELATTNPPSPKFGLCGRI